MLFKLCTSSMQLESLVCGLGYAAGGATKHLMQVTTATHKLLVKTYSGTLQAQILTMYGILKGFSKGRRLITY
jgi:hypothetical protein